MFDWFRKHRHARPDFRLYRKQTQTQMQLSDEKKEELTQILNQQAIADPMLQDSSSSISPESDHAVLQPYFPEKKEDTRHTDAPRRLLRWGALAAALAIISIAAVTVLPYLQGIRAANGTDESDTAVYYPTMTDVPIMTTAVNTTLAPVPSGEGVQVSTRPVTTATYAFTPDLNRIRWCINFNYNASIIRGLSEGTLSKQEQTTLESELNYYRNLQGGHVVFSDDDPTVMGDAAAIAKAKEYIQQLFSYTVPEDAQPTILRYDFRQSQSNEYLQWNRYYGISFENGENCSYGVNVDAESGRCMGGGMIDLPDLSAQVFYDYPPDEVVSRMQSQAKQFVVDAELFPDSTCEYVCSEMQAFNDFPEPVSEMQTEVYLDNGYIVDVHQGFAEGTRLYFNVFPSHGFKN